MKGILILISVGCALVGCGSAPEEPAPAVLTGTEAKKAMSKMHGPVGIGGGTPASNGSAAHSE